MSSLASWSYTAPCTIWKPLGKDKRNQALGWSAPLVIMADYQGGLSKRLGDIGSEQVVKNTIWTEYAGAEMGDYLLIGESANPDPIDAGADRVMQAIRYADTFERLTDDYAILTGV